MKEADLVAAAALGGALGALGRYGLSAAIPHVESGFPAATFIANVVGSALLGSLFVLSVEVWRPTRLVRPFAGTGLLGGFTTFSTFSVETRDLLAAGIGWLALGYAAASVLAALMAVRLATILTRRLAHVDPEDSP